MKTSPAGIALICKYEGCKLTAYPDASTRRIWTVGYGHTGAGVTQGLTITQERAEQLLAADLVTFETAVRALTSPMLVTLRPGGIVVCVLTQGQFDALVSFSYNVGAHTLAASTLLRKLNAGDIGGAAAEFAKWTHAGAEVLPGLVRRRAAERALFLGEITT
jgi:lysozyme